MDPERFGSYLKGERERRGITLAQIAQQTKVGAWMFDSLEGADLSRWPAGLYRRSFVRSYAKAIGLDPEEVVREFVRLFPDEASRGVETSDRRAPAARRRHRRPATAAAMPPPAAATRPHSSLRLTFAQETGSRSRWVDTPGGHVALAALELAFMLAMALPAGLTRGAPAFWIALALAATAYHLVGTLLLGSSPLARLWRGRARAFGRRARTHRAGSPAAADRAARSEPVTLVRAASPPHLMEGEPPAIGPGPLPSPAVPRGAWCGRRATIDSFPYGRNSHSRDQRRRRAVRGVAGAG